MQSMTQPKETVQDAEQRLWSQYILAEITVTRVHYEYNHAWRNCVMHDDRETAARWEVLATMWRNVRENADMAYKAWQQVAYPLYGMPLPDEND